MAASEIAAPVGVVVKKKKKTLAFLSAPKPTRAPAPKPTERAADDSDDDDGLALFSRSKDFFAKAIRDQKATQLRKTEGDDKDKKRRSSSESNEFDNDEADTPTKRRKMAQTDRSQHVLEEDIYNATPPLEPSAKLENTESRPIHHTPVKLLAKASTRRNPTPSKSGTDTESPKRPAQTATIAIDDDSDDNDTGTVARHGDSGTNVVQDEDEDDPFEIEEVAPPTEKNLEMAEFIRQAREARDAAAAAANALPTPQSPKAQLPNPATPTDEQVSSTPREPAAKPKADTIKVHLRCAVSGAPDVKMWGCYRKTDQDFKPLVAFWITHAAKYGLLFEKEDEKNLVLTWRGRRVYTFSTAASLGITAEEVKRMRRSGTSDGLNASDGGLIFEIQTEEDYTVRVQAEERRKLRDQGDVDDTQILEDDEFGNKDTVAKPSGPKIRVTLKAKDMEPMRSTTYPSVTVSWLVNAFRRHRGVAADKQITLRYDGEELTDEQTMEEADIEDQVTIEVYIK